MTTKVAGTALMTDSLVPTDAAEDRSASFALLIERACAGDLAAFEQVVICSERRVIRVAWRILGSEEDARDAAQEVFMRLYKHLHRFKREQDFDAWLYRITVNVCRDIWRKRRKSGGSAEWTSLETAREEGQLETLASSDDAEAAALLAQKREMIRRALETLPEKERTALVLRDLEGFSTEEVARILGTRPATVRSQISMARRKIKLYCDRILRRQGGGEMDCSKVEKLLPLYAGTDLEDDLLSAVSLHLRACQQCSRLADEYRESRQWLRSSCAPPKFDAAFYGGIRSAVLEEINRETIAPALWQLPLQLLRRRLIFVTPVVLLLVASALPIYLSLRRTNSEQSPSHVAVINGTNMTQQPVKAQEKTSPRRTFRASAVKKAARRDKIVAQAGSLRWPDDRPRGRNFNRPKMPSYATSLNLPPLPSEVSAEPQDIGEALALTTTEAIDRETTRIEIQTSDPNIRIIWFSPKGTE